MSDDVRVLQRIEIKKTTSGEVSYLDFDFANDFQETDSISPTQLTVSLTPPGEVVQVTGVAINALRVTIKLDAHSGVPGKEYLLQVEAVTVTGLRKTLEAVIKVF